MMWILRSATALTATSLMLTVAAASEPTTDKGKTTDMPAKLIYEFTVKDIDGKDVALSQYKGGVLLIVNVASK